MAKGLRVAQKRSLKFKHVVVLIFILAIMSLSFVSMLRSDSQVLDEQIAAIQVRLTACEKECRDLEREVAAMMSPKAVHVFADKKLGMTQVHMAGTIRLDGAVRIDGTTTAVLANVTRGY